MILEIKIYPDKILKQKAKKVGMVDGEIKKLLSDMADTLYAKRGVGLAANQVGIAKQIILVDIGEGLKILLNPKITSKKGKAVYAEGCLSLPGMEFEIKRPKKIEVEYMDRNGREQKIKAEDLLARAICHEVDHLQGKTILDRLGFFERRKAKKNFE